MKCLDLFPCTTFVFINVQPLCIKSGPLVLRIDAARYKEEMQALISEALDFCSCMLLVSAGYDKRSLLLKIHNCPLYIQKT